MGVAAAELVSSARPGMPAEMKLYSRVAHSVNDQELNDLKEFIVNALK
jgi:hypothetical protein